MLRTPLLGWILGSALLAAAGPSCTTKANYLDPEGPRYSASYAPQPVVARAASAPADVDLARSGTLKVVSYNVRYGEQIDEAIEVLAGTPELADAEVFLLQEMSPLGVDRIARALDCGYVYYPATLRSSGREFGNAVLTRARILGDRKVLLPHVNPFNRQHRIAVHTDLEVGADRLHAYSVHTETPALTMEGRMEQIEELLDSVPEDARPCVVAGDFNTMGEHSLERFESAFSRRGFSRASAELRPTFGLGPMRFEMDHVFVRGLKVVDAGVVEAAGASDHLPVWVELRWLAPSGGDGAEAGAGDLTYAAATLSSVVLAAAARPALEERVRPLASFPEERVEIRAWMKRHEWKSKRHNPRRFELEHRRMHLVSADDSVVIGTKKGFPIDPQVWPRLRFRLRVDEVPTGTKLAKKSGDDAAFRVYVAFDRGGGLISPPNTIAYTWTEKLAPGTLVQSPHFKRLRYLSIGKGVTTGVEAGAHAVEGGADPGWVQIERDLLADYRRVFGGSDVPALVGIALKCDSNNTGTSASAWLEKLELASVEREED